jgi:hypothetical protein
MPHRLDALVMIIRASTRLVREPRPCRDAVLRHRSQPWLVQQDVDEQKRKELYDAKLAKLKQMARTQC